MMTRIIVLFYILSLIYLFPGEYSSARGASFDDTGWTLVYQENFDTPFEASDGQTFGTDNWLTFQLLNGGTMTIAGGYAQLNAPDFWNAGLIHSTDVLPSEYKVRTKIGFINYDLTNYEQADYDNPDFNNHLGHYENGMYFLTVTDDTCSGGECAEDWWHHHRKMVLDVDNHINWSGGGETFHPVYMVYMSPETDGGGNILRTWNGSIWDISPDNWNVAHTYDYDTWYYAEMEKVDNHLILRLYDEYKNILEETTPATLDSIFAMDIPEFLYVGEPHTDDYEGNVRIDEITLLVPDNGTVLCGDVNGDGLVNVNDIIELINYKFKEGPAPLHPEAADVNSDGSINVIDILRMINYKFKNGPDLNCP